VLYDPEKFDPLVEEVWREGAVRDAIRELVDDTDRGCRPRRLWPADDWDGWQSPKPLKTLYSGAAGVVWALAALRERGYAESQLDLEAVVRRALEAWREKPGVLTILELPEPARASVLMGETGILLVLWRLAPSEGLANTLLERVAENDENPGEDVMWGAPGTMLAARAMLDWTGEERWSDAWRRAAAALLDRRDDEGLWMQTLHGESSRGLGPPHGLVGNVLALLGGGDLLAEETRRELVGAGAAALGRAAVVEDGLANWPTAAGEPLRGADGELRLQWDYGGPGIVATAADYVDEELLLAGAELAWRAGPHGAEKGPCICHGTAGNGYAFLKVFERTGDERWLERARRFAVHALAQVREGRERRGRGRYSLWTGDLGVALYAADCIEGRAAYPIFDTPG
jgi:Lanthionine synthetase C-like protein